jgi:hypothetical protein
MLLPSYVLRFISTINHIINPATNSSNFPFWSIHGSPSMVKLHII